MGAFPFFLSAGRRAEKGPIILWMDDRKPGEALYYGLLNTVGCGRRQNMKMENSRIMGMEKTGQTFEVTITGRENFEWQGTIGTPEGGSLQFRSVLELLEQLDQSIAAAEERT